jgi:hypothetical protein
MKTVIVAITLSTSLAAGQSPPVIKAGTMTPGDIALAVAGIPRIPAPRFAALPPSAREALTAINCQVPQSTPAGSANVIEGEFAAVGQRDWAALCSNSTITDIRVVWGGPVRCEDRHAAIQDSDSIVQKSAGVFTYARTIGVASIEHISRYLIRHRAALPDKPAHDAIEDSNGRSSLVYYCHGGRWQMIPGAG